MTIRSRLLVEVSCCQRRRLSPASPEELPSEALRLQGSPFCHGDRGGKARLALPRPRSGTSSLYAGVRTNENEAPDEGVTEMILVVGGTGDLGGRVVRILSEQGHRVRCLVRPPATTPSCAASESTWLRVT